MCGGHERYVDHYNLTGGDRRMKKMLVFFGAFWLLIPSFSYAGDTKVYDANGQYLGIEVEMGGIDAFIQKTERSIDEFYERIPPEVREPLDRLKETASAETTEPGPITEEDKKKILDDIEKFFKPGPGEH